MHHYSFPLHEYGPSARKLLAISEVAIAQFGVQIQRGFLYCLPKRL
jgi:hypothetical protein